MQTAFENLMGETETQNGLIFKNLAVSIYSLVLGRWLRSAF